MASTRALGINAQMVAAFEDPAAYGTPPTTGYVQLPFVSSQLGEEQPLIEDDQLGYGREGLDPTYDVITNAGDVVVPVNSRAIGWWLKLLLGQPVSTGLGSASGGWTFSAQPAVGATLTVNGSVFTFVASGATGPQISIGGSLSATIANAVTVLNASTDPNVTPATYSSAGGGTKLNVSYDTAGLNGNNFTLNQSGSANATRTAVKLMGGTQQHVFTSGAASLPSASIEIGMPEVPAYELNYGVRANTMKISLARSGMLNATFSCIGQGTNDDAGASISNTTSTLTGTRFAQATGSIQKDGVVLGNVVSADVSYSNQLDPVEVIRGDGRIADADPGKVMSSGGLTIKFDTTGIKAQAEAETPCALSFGWANGAWSLMFSLQRVFLPKPKNPITGPKGITAEYQWQGSGAAGAQFVATLVNDRAGY